MRIACHDFLLLRPSDQKKLLVLLAADFQPVRQILHRVRGLAGSIVLKNISIQTCCFFITARPRSL
jgi:hypothetical protein